MGIKTTLSPQDFAKILAHYNLGEFKSFQPFEQGLVQTNGLLETTADKVAFRYYENRSEKYALFEAHLLKYLASKKYPCPAPIKNIQGGLVAKYQGKPLALFQFLPGKLSREPQNYRQIIAIFARLHVLTADYKPHYPETRNAYDPATCWQSAEVNGTKIAEQAEAYSRLRWLKAELKDVRLPKSLPRGICHYDSNWANFLYHDGRLTGVLDFDHASYIALIYDIAGVMYWWAWPNTGDLDFKVAREVVQEYEKTRVLSQQEKEHVFDALKMGILMSVGWFIHVDEDFASEQRKVEFLNRLGREEFYVKVFG
jgi:homoserine kinase type II